eukprot:CCRYP_020204-RA/>CCRYP_020204-RA protein AED:0.61 eAED:0.42 QI:0/0/0/1/1/0.5/2/0/171
MSCRTRSKPGDYLSVHYNGTLYSDGSLFDSSILRAICVSYRKATNERRLEKGLLNMCVGEKRKLVVPSGMAYGASKANESEISGRVHPDSTVVYDVKLLKILDEEEATPHLLWRLKEALSCGRKSWFFIVCCCSDSVRASLQDIITNGHSMSSDIDNDLYNEQTSKLFFAM